MKLIQAFLRDQSGATSIEYSIMASCIALAVITAVGGLGTKVKGTYTTVSTALK